MYRFLHVLYLQVLLVQYVVVPGGVSCIGTEYVREVSLEVVTLDEVILGAAVVLNCHPWRLAPVRLDDRLHGGNVLCA